MKNRKMLLPTLLSIAIIFNLLLPDSIVGTSAAMPWLDECILTISSTAGGSVPIPGEGTFTYDKETLVDLVAEAEENYRFISWTGDVDTIADVDATKTTIMMNDDYSITANFDQILPRQFSLTISSTEGGSVTTPGEGYFTYFEGTVVSLMATPKGGYPFVKWTGDVGTIANVYTTSTNITMQGNYLIVAIFGRDCNC